MSRSREVLAFGFVIPFVLLVCLEVSFRFAGYPQGIFAEILPSSGTLYPPNLVIPMNWGPIHYKVTTNSLGLRGEEISLIKQPGTLRIVTVGDSLTDGFFVDNDGTWQHFLQQMLQNKLTRKVEVVNCAKGGGSIDKELQELKLFGLPLNPDLVILTFCVNDIADILDVPLSQLHEERYTSSGPKISERLVRFLLTKTALCEAVLDGYLRLRSPSYRESRNDEAKLRAVGNDRYNIEGGNNFQINAEETLMLFEDTDGIILKDSFSEATQKAIGNYKLLLTEMAITCKKNNSRLLFVFVPAYSQIYKANSSSLINSELRRMCDSLQIDFLDLTQGLRENGFQKPLHLAPVDYHFNPYGNLVIASILEKQIVTTFSSGRVLN